MTPVGFEPSISAGDRSKTYTLERAATGTGPHCIWDVQTSTNKLQEKLLSSSDSLIYSL
jgi:hypothetical protein